MIAKKNPLEMKLLLFFIILIINKTSRNTSLKVGYQLKLIGTFFSLKLNNYEPNTLGKSILTL